MTPESEGAEHRVYTPAEAAEQLQISPATLRRMARSYERAYEQLPRDNRGDRLWPTNALERLQAARTLRELGKANSLEMALGLLATGEEGPSSVLERASAPEPWEIMVAELRAVREAVERLEVENKAIKEQLRALPTPQGDTEAIRKCLAYLEGELKRRDELPAPRRLWWKVWRK